MGACIETLYLLLHFFNIQSRPSWARVLKQTEGQEPNLRQKSRPSWACIETNNSNAAIENTASRPSWARVLKHDEMPGLDLDMQSRPSWARVLKPARHVHRLGHL